MQSRAEEILRSEQGFGTGELEKAIQTFKMWAQTYPRDWLPLHNIGAVYSDLGQYEKAVEGINESLKLYPDNVTAYENLGMFYISLDRLAEAQAATEQAFARKLGDHTLHKILYDIAFLRGDPAAMAKAVAWFDGKPKLEFDILGRQAGTEAYFGRMKQSRELTRRAIVSAESAQNEEAASGMAAGFATEEASYGNVAGAREWVSRAAKLWKQGSPFLALAFARIGDESAAQAIMIDLNKRLPLHTLTQSIWLPIVRAQLALHRKSPALAIEALQPQFPMRRARPPVPACIRSIFEVRLIWHLAKAPPQLLNSRKSSIIAAWCVRAKPCRWLG